MVPSLTQPAGSPGMYHLSMCSSSFRMPGRSMFTTPYSRWIFALVVWSSWWLVAWPPWCPPLELSESEDPPPPPNEIPKMEPKPPASVSCELPLYHEFAKLELCEPPDPWELVVSTSSSTNPMSLFVWSYHAAGVTWTYWVLSATTPASDRSHLSNTDRACERKNAAAE